ncbi:acetyl-CoA decarbonylase/synthase complex subunit delta [Candidatus Magnetominusculus xianensis]|uniref:Acetyl-CoA decarbonylase/synthase subunit delta n=1 Tax=Candidatus Magnetominusculus xianensis TaxID=1748249 RepID=A0ABR5SGG8_9BACT|nr:acetyl-CoA decarbonylase/synthase complex subunit delta [Candidatus Magnetominusculus xianensis]KWT78984.1 acetyl-CoA decarbonylase/synthase subunit delta [Candidatus Magnetominusculus xianensis]MBF0405009.1 acetyl-CoA decarbonylase/synthase complex subunit delta [Nitrospirota bacterium]
MAFTPPKETNTGKVYSVTMGTGDKAVTIGGENVLPFHGFEGVVPNKPVIAFDVMDIAPVDWPDTVREIYAGVSDDPVTWAKFCVEKFNAKAICLRLAGTHPDNGNRSAAEAAETVKKVLDAVSVPLIILGSNHVEKDTEVLVKTAEVAKGRNCVIGKAQEANYKTVAAAAMAHDHLLIAMSELDINLSKQLNIMITQLGFNKEKIIIDPMCSALGYGLEYTYTVMERIRLAALTQNDVTMQQPIVGDVGMYVWKIKEVSASEDTLPMWGALKERGIGWEAQTATALLMSGAELLIMRHPEAVAAVEAFINEMM